MRYSFVIFVIIFLIFSYQDFVEEEDNEDIYSSDPQRNPDLKVVSQRPFNAETPLSSICSNPITPTDLFFVRNHLPVPDVDPE